MSLRDEQAEGDVVAGGGDAADLAAGAATVWTRGGVLTGSGQVVAGTSKRYTGRSVPAGSSRVPVTLRLVGAPAVSR